MYLPRGERFDCFLSEAHLLPGFYMDVIMFYVSLGGLLFSSDNTGISGLHSRLPRGVRPRLEASLIAQLVKNPPAMQETLV